MKQKNVLWFVTDQQRSHTLSINGCPDTFTPNLDNLAKAGINITSAISGTPLCCPFRGSLLTGLYPHKCVPGHEYQLNPELPTIASVFGENGYHTFYLGKWHLDGAKEPEKRAGTHIVPRHRRGGFTSWMGYENNNAQYDCYIHGHKDDTEVDLFRLPGYETDCLTDIMIDYLQEKAKGDKPFFAVLSVQPPHDPYVAPPEFQGRHRPGDITFRPNVPDIQSVRETAAVELAGYHAMVENIDYNVGRVVEALKQTGLMDDTHLLYFSDHGDMHGSHGQFRKTTPYQEAVSIPFIISGENRGGWAAGRAVGNRSDILMNHVDIAPTTLGLCSISVPDWMEGTDYSAVRYRNSNPAQYPESAYLQSVIPTNHQDSINKPWRGVITSDGYKLVCFERMDWLLFDLNNDPYEQMNLAHNSKYSPLRERLLKELRYWVDKTGDQFILPSQ